MKTAAKKNKVSLTIVLDFIHVLEYLWKAAHGFFTPGAKEAEPWVMERALRLLQGKVSDVAAGIRRSATLQKLSESARENADTAVCSFISDSSSSGQTSFANA